MSAESIGQTAFPGVAWPRDAKPTHPGAAGSTVGQNRAKILPKEAVWSTRRVEIGESKRKFPLKTGASRFFLLFRRVSALQALVFTRGVGPAGWTKTGPKPCRGRPFLYRRSWNRRLKTEIPTNYSSKCFFDWMYRDCA